MEIEPLPIDMRLLVLVLKPTAARGHKACRENMSVLYTRMPRLFADLAIAHGDARYGRLLRSIARVKLLILDDWGPESLTPDQARDLLEIVEDRYDKGSLVITSQVPVDRWHEMIGVPTLADAILDRIVRSLRTGDKVEIRGFGSLRTRQRQPRIGRNPKTGARVDVPAKKVPYFKPSKELKDLVNGPPADTPPEPRFISGPVPNPQ